MKEFRRWAGLVYAVIGLFGVFVNVVLLAAVVCLKSYHRSAYILMANIALADSCVMLVAGCLTGLAFATEQPTLGYVGDGLVSFLQISGWIAMMVTYAFLGINRCIAIRFYRTSWRTLNRVGSAMFMSLVGWAAGLGLAAFGSLPSPPVMRISPFTLSLHYSVLRTAGGAGANRTDDGDDEFRTWNLTSRALLVAAANMLVNLLSLTVQWVCSVMVLLKVRQVHTRISSRSVTSAGAMRFRKQVRLTFQFFYPSLICTVVSVSSYLIPLLAEHFVSWAFFLCHLLLLANHGSNPWIYLYFNEKMRATVSDWMHCRMAGGPRLSRRPPAAQLRNAPRIFEPDQNQVAHVKGRAGVVRNSLQLQSRDFNQLCELMVQLGNRADSSEGWCTSSGGASSEEEDEHDQRNSAALSNQVRNGRRRHTAPAVTPSVCSMEDNENRPNEQFLTVRDTHF